MCKLPYYRSLGMKTDGFWSPLLQNPTMLPFFFFFNFLFKNKTKKKFVTYFKTCGSSLHYKLEFWFETYSKCSQFHYKIMCIQIAYSLLSIRWHMTDILFGAKDGCFTTLLEWTGCEMYYMQLELTCQMFCNWYVHFLTYMYRGHVPSYSGRTIDLLIICQNKLVSLICLFFK